MLVLPHFQGSFEVVTDTYNKQIVFVNLQKPPEGTYHPLVLVAIWKPPSAPTIPPLEISRSGVGLVAAPALLWWLSFSILIDESELNCSLSQTDLAEIFACLLLYFGLQIIQNIRCRNRESNHRCFITTNENWKFQRLMDNEILLLCIWASSSREWEATNIYMQDWDVLKAKADFELLAVEIEVTLAEPKHDERPVRYPCLAV